MPVKVTFSLTMSPVVVDLLAIRRPSVCALIVRLFTDSPSSPHISPVARCRAIRVGYSVNSTQSPPRTQSSQTMVYDEPGAALTDRIIRLGIKVHRKLGPGLLESVYQECLCWELAHGGLAFRRQVPLAIVY
jgi:hypothetical protein